MIKYDCAHLKPVTNNDILENNRGSLRCDVHRAVPDGTSRAGISCPSDCMGYRPSSKNKGNNEESALAVFKKAIKSLIGKN